MPVSLMADCKLSDVDPLRRLAKTLRAAPKGGIGKLMPGNFAPPASLAASVHNPALAKGQH